MQFPHHARTVTAASAAVLLIISIVALTQGGWSVNGDGRPSVRGSSDDEGGGGELLISIDDVGGDDGDFISSERRRGHHGHHGSGHGGGNDRSRASPSNHREADESGFDYYVYAMSYQPEFCRENGERFAGCRDFGEEREGRLTIHGLWPSRNDGSWPSHCSDENLDLSLLDDGARDDLEEKWPNAKAPASASPGHDAFWAHEWSKHGTCSGLEQRDYFATALDLLLPTPDVVKENYGSVAKREDLEEGYPGNDMSVLVCERGYLSEVRVCFEKKPDGAPGERVACSQSMARADSCGDEIRIASFDSR